MHKRIYPHTDVVTQYANENPDGSIWIVDSRQVALRNERRGYGKALIRLWEPSEWKTIQSEGENIE